RLERDGVREAGVGLPAPASDLGVVALDLVHLLGCEGVVPGGDAVVGRALEHEQLAGLLGDDRRGLDAGGARADQPDALARDIDALLRPRAGVVPFPLERVEAGDLWHVGRREAAHGADEEAR